MKAEKEGWISGEDGQEGTFDREQWTVGTAIVIDPANPPWGKVSHAGWTAPTHARGETLGNLQFATVIAELPHLIEARAVSLAPPDPNEEAGFFNEQEVPVADMVVVETLRRQKTMGLREYLTQLSYLGLINPPAVGQEFLSMYEKARFCGRPCLEHEFNDLMATFAQLLEGMAELHPDIVTEIRAQAGSESFPTTSSSSTSTMDADRASLAMSEATGSVLHFATPEPPRSSSSSSSSAHSPVTARTAFSRAVTPYMQSSGLESEESFNSVIRRPATEDLETPRGHGDDAYTTTNDRSNSPSLRTLNSDAGSVLHHRISNG